MKVDKWHEKEVDRELFSNALFVFRRSRSRSANRENMHRSLVHYALIGASDKIHACPLARISSFVLQIAATDVERKRSLVMIMRLFSFFLPCFVVQCVGSTPCIWQNPLVLMPSVYFPPQLFPNPSLTFHQRLVKLRVPFWNIFPWSSHAK